MGYNSNQIRTYLLVGEVNRLGSGISPAGFGR